MPNEPHADPIIERLCREYTAGEEARIASQPSPTFEDLMPGFVAETNAALDAIARTGKPEARYGFDLESRALKGEFEAAMDGQLIRLRSKFDRQSKTWKATDRGVEVLAWICLVEGILAATKRLGTEAPFPS